MDNIKINSLNIKVYLLQNVVYTDVYKAIANLLDAALIKNEKMTVLHNSKSYKPYVFCGFKQREEDKIYRKGNIYDFSIRCIDDEIARYFIHTLANESTDVIKGLVVESKVIPKAMISILYSLTPVIIKNNSGYWNGNLSFEQFEKRLVSNAYKKYSEITHQKADESEPLYDSIKMLNQKPIKFNLKNISLLGDKVELNIASNEQAQNIAYMLLGVGLAEDNSRGAGYMNYKLL